MERKSIMSAHAKAAQKKQGVTKLAQPNEMTRIREVLDRNGNVIERTVQEPKGKK